ncbi:ABC transporter substrate-binding protein [Streptomyces sp. NPDC008092]|uniref:ABC transporter substrate-binding protein n=1 Tax=Streptomyces sp. NPDC008092 TaxID=3364808 RepID=UPI0036E978D0
MHTDAIGRTSGRKGVLGAALVLLLATACSAGTTDSTGVSAAGLPTVRVALGVDASYAPFYLAEERGLFRKAGVDVELVKTEGGPAASQAVTAGTAQIAANADSTALPLMVNDPGLRALGVFQSSDRYLKVVLRDGITKPGQIRTMASIGGLGLYATHQYLLHNGIDPNSVKILQSSAPEMPGMLERGSIDGYVLYEPWAAKGAASGGHVTARIGDFGVRYVQWLLADQSWLKDNEDTAGKVFKAVAQADELVTSDPAAAAEATNKQVKLPVADTEKVLPEITFSARGLDGADVTSSQKIVDFLLDQKLVKKSPDLGTTLLKGWYDQYAR